MAERDWNEREGGEFSEGLSGEPFDLSLRRLFGDGDPLDASRSLPDGAGEPRKLLEKEVRIVGVYEQRTQERPPDYFVLVRDNRDRNLRIYIGQSEAYSISMAIEGRAPNRPMTHDLARIIVERLGWAVDRVIVDDEYNGIYYAKLTLVEGAGTGVLDIDCRPSDAIALAVRARAPLYVAESVLEAEGRKEQEL
jgi:bifunctional DNase/RNase